MAHEPPLLAFIALPTDDDGRRDDPLLSGTPTRSPGTGPTTTHCAALTRLVVGMVTEFPSHHGGFLGVDIGYGGEPDAFAARLPEVLDDGAE